METLDPQDLREEAFTAPPFTWRNLTLHPFAIGREADWLLHCRRIGLPPVTEGFTVAHAFRLLWFCAHEPSVWLAVWMAGGRASPVYLDTLIRDWAEKNIPPGEQPAAVQLASEIYDRAYASQATVSSEDDDEDAVGNAAGPSDVLNTSASSHGPVPASSLSSSSITTTRRSAAGPSSMPTSAAAAASPPSPPTPRPKKKHYENVSPGVGDA